MTEPPSQLIARYLAGEPVADELLALCRTCPAAADELARHIALERLLRAELSRDQRNALLPEEIIAQLNYDAQAELFAGRITTRLQQMRTLRIRRRRTALWALAAGVAVLLTGSFWLRSPGPSFARLIAAEAAEWKGSGIALGAPVGNRPVTLTQGFIQLRFNHGTLLVVEAPARFTIRGEKRVRLDYGRAVATVPQAGHGFVIDSPDAEVIDLGTQFGVDVNSAQDTEVHVLQGHVRVRPRGETKSTDVFSNEAVRVTSASFQTQPVEAELDRFLPELPERDAGRTANYLHWSFDEGRGTQCRPSGRGMDIQAGLGRFATTATNATESDLPRWITGVFGQALQFSGHGAYVDTAFPGIAGPAPRTVTFWTKVPTNATLGYAALGWGTFSTGQVWQISLNPNAREGLAGRLRVGILPGMAIGAKDLRDGKWHHIAVVLYPSTAEQPANLRYHVLLYVDGELEPTTRKSLQNIQTVTRASDAAPLRIGCSADMRPPTFSGNLDELYIFDQALNAAEIRRLVIENRID